MLWDKGVGVLVDAARLLNESKASAQGKVRVALVGVPDPGNPASIDEATLRGWVAEGVVEWWGWQEDMSTVYARGHIVTLPTVYGEGVPTALLEAAACGKPLVATDAPGCREVVRHELNGLLVPPNDRPRWLPPSGGWLMTRTCVVEWALQPPACAGKIHHRAGELSHTAGI